MNIAVSACLLGKPCRYDGQHQLNTLVKSLFFDKTHTIVPLCPEVFAGLPTPRSPHEIKTNERALRVVDVQGNDNTCAFMAGAQKALDLAESHGCSLAILKAKSPSCGNGYIYDGTFSGNLVFGYGVAARLFRGARIRVVDEAQVRQVVKVSEARHPGTMPALFATSSAQCPVLETSRLVLRPLTHADSEDVFRYSRDPDIGADAGWSVHRSVDDSRAFIELIASKPHVYGIFEKQPEGAGSSAGACIGSVGLIPDEQRKNIDCLMLGYALAKHAWGRGYMTEASQEVIRYGFEELALGMITATHYTFNKRSERVIEKCGFHYEGIWRAAEASPDGTLQDLASYSLTEREWRLSVMPETHGENRCIVGNTQQPQYNS